MVTAKVAPSQPNFSFINGMVCQFGDVFKRLNSLKRRWMDAQPPGPADGKRFNAYSVGGDFDPYTRRSRWGGNAGLDDSIPFRIGSNEVVAHRHVRRMPDRADDTGGDCPGVAV